MLISEVVNPEKIRGKELMHAWKEVASKFKAKVSLRSGIPTLSPSVEIALITTSPQDRGKGYASAALQEITSLADKFGVKLTLNPCVIGAATDPTVLPQDKLEQWYGRYGFKQSPVEEYYLERVPRVKGQF